MAIHFDVDTGTQVSDAVDPLFFGGNFLADRDDLTGSFVDKADYLGLTMLRFPGGAIAEDSFDIENPDTPISNGTGGATSLSEFLTFCAANDIVPTVVIPTKRYADDIAAGVAAVRSFAARLEAGDFGPTDNLILQIGNEFYSGNETSAAMTENQYGDMASQFATAIADEMTVDPDISVQIGRRLPESNRILAHFDTEAEKAAVTSLTVHQYPWTLEAVDIRWTKMQDRIAAWESVLGARNVFMSEWNVGSSPDSALDALHDYGLAQNAALLEILFESMKLGIDRGAIWGVQQRSKTALTSDEGEDDIWAAGELFAMMSAHLPGSHALQQAWDTGGDTSVVTYGFESDTQLSVFVVARDIDLSDGPVTVNLGLTGEHDRFSDFSATRLSTTTIGDHPKPRGVVTDATPEIVTDDGGMPTLRFDMFRDDEIVFLTFTKSDAGDDAVIRRGTVSDDFLSGGTGDDLIKGNWGTDYLVSLAGDDDLRGGQGADEIDAGIGDDLLKGGSGADTLIGRDGNDTITGNAGRDRIIAGDGDDLIDGGNGRDIILGGAGNDRIDGGADNDRIWGGAGADHFVFSDNFGFDRIHDFRPGQDYIDVSALGSVSEFADLLPLLSHTGRNIVLTMAEGTLVLNRLSLSDIGAEDFIF